jgi:hypothetical protein
MAKTENLPFDRGEYDTTGAFADLVGREWEIEDYDWNPSTFTGGARQLRSGKMVTVRLVKNSATVALLPKHMARYSTTAGEYGHNVNGDVRLAAEDWAGVVDEFLPTAGAPVDSYFYIVVKGPSKVITPDAGAAFNGDITVGALLVAATAAASTGVTSGRVGVANVTASTQTADYSLVQDPIVNAIGRALSAATTGNTRTDIFADVGRW